MDQSIITQCPQCGSDRIEEDHNFCTSCACDLKPHKTKLRCCGRSILVMHDAYNFCCYCGAKDPLGRAEA